MTDPVVHDADLGVHDEVILVLNDVAIRALTMARRP